MWAKTNNISFSFPNSNPIRTTTTTTTSSAPSSWIDDTNGTHSIPCKRRDKRATTRAFAILNMSTLRDLSSKRNWYLLPQTGFFSRNLLPRYSTWGPLPIDHVFTKPSIRFSFQPKEGATSFFVNSSKDVVNWVRKRISKSLTCRMGAW